MRQEAGNDLVWKRTVVHDVEAHCQIVGALTIEQLPFGLYELHIAQPCLSSIMTGHGKGHPIWVHPVHCCFRQSSCHSVDSNARTTTHVQDVGTRLPQPLHEPAAAQSTEHLWDKSDQHELSDYNCPAQKPFQWGSSSMGVGRQSMVVRIVGSK